jgi:hypothetical protein
MPAAPPRVELGIGLHPDLQAAAIVVIEALALRRPEEMYEARVPG